MLKQLTLKNWKSFDQAVVYFDPLTVLIGTNGSGKSNLIEALDFLQRIASGIDVRTAIEGGRELVGIRGGIDKLARLKDQPIGLELLVNLDENLDYLYIIEIEIKTKNNSIRNISSTERGFLINIATGSDICNFRLSHGLTDKSIELINSGLPTPVNFENGIFSISNDALNESLNLFPQSIVGNNDELSDSDAPISNLDKFLDARLKLSRHVAEKIKNIFILDPIPKNMRGYSALSEDLNSDASNIAGVLAALQAPQKTEVINKLTEYLKRLPEGDIKSVGVDTVGRLKVDAMLYCEEQWHNDPTQITTIDARSMSDGTLRFLAIMTALLTRPEHSQIVIEEIDNGLHPSRAIVLVKMINEISHDRHIDVLITTHNPALLDAFGTEIMPFVTIAHRDPVTGASELSLLEDMDNLALILARGSLGNLTTKGELEKELHKA
jgi:predicted ATPase